MSEAKIPLVQTSDDYRPNKYALSNAEVRAAGILAQGAYLNISRELLAARERIAQLEARVRECEWISVEERLPQDGVEVLFNVPGCYGVEKGRLYQGKWVSDRTSPYNDEVSWENRHGEVDYWRPLPEPPRVSGQAGE